MSDQQAMSSGAISSLKKLGGAGGATGAPMTMNTVIGDQVFSLDGNTVIFSGSLDASLEGAGAKEIAQVFNESSMIKGFIGSDPEFYKGSPGANVTPTSAIGPTMDLKTGIGVQSK